MDEKQKNLKKQDISPIMWIFWLVSSTISGVLGIVLIYAFGFLDISFLLVGFLILITSSVLFILFIKELIAEANIRALEVYYGKKRKIINNSNKEDNNFSFD